MSNSPPGVTGNEYPIAGPDYVTELGTTCTVMVPVTANGMDHERECGEAMREEGYGHQRWAFCDFGHEATPPASEYDGPDTLAEKNEGRDDR
jgi:hypothetical protein